MFVVIVRIRRLVGAFGHGNRNLPARSFVFFQAPESFKLIRRKIRSGKAQADGNLPLSQFLMPGAR